MNGIHKSWQIIPVYQCSGKNLHQLKFIMPVYNRWKSEPLVSNCSVDLCHQSSSRCDVCFFQYEGSSCLSWDLLHSAYRELQCLNAIWRSRLSDPGDILACSTLSDFCALFRDMKVLSSPRVTLGLLGQVGSIHLENGTEIFGEKFFFIYEQAVLFLVLNNGVACVLKSFTN